MAELHLGKQETTRYGSRFKGFVETEEGNIPITWREPPNYDRVEAAYVLATGWLGARDSMRIPAHEAVRAGHVAVSFDYTNTSIRHPLEQNEESLAAVLDSLPEDLRRAAIGLSMGGRVLTRALTRTGTRVETATMVASAGYIKNRVNHLKALQRLLKTTPETTHFFLRDPIQAMHVGAAAVGNCMRRKGAVIGEMHELVNGMVHDHIIDIKKEPDPPYLRFIYGKRDRLLPASLQEDGVADLPFDHIEAYDGGHIDLVRYPEIARRIFEQDDDVFQPLQKAA